MPPNAKHTYKIANTEELVRVAEYGTPSDSILIFIAGYYTGTDSLGPLAIELANKGQHVAIIELFAKPTWINSSLPFTKDVPDILKAWVSGADRALEEITYLYPQSNIHLVGFSFGGPAATLLNQYRDYPAKTLSLIAPVGTQGPIERLALWCRSTKVLIPIAFMMEYVSIYMQIIRGRIQKNIARHSPKLYEKYQIIMADQERKFFEGANTIGLKIARAKLEFKLINYLTGASRSKIHIVAHKRDAYISVAAMRKLAQKSNAVLSITNGTHNRAKDHPEEIADLIDKFIGNNSVA